MDPVDGNAIGGLLIDVLSHEQPMSMSDEPQEESMSMGQPDQESM